MKRLFSVKNLAIFAVIVSLSVSLISAQFELMTKRQHLNNLDKQEQRIALETADAQRILESETQEEYIERMARQRLGYGNPNEKVYIDIQSE